MDGTQKTYQVRRKNLEDPTSMRLIKRLGGEKNVVATIQKIEIAHYTTGVFIDTSILSSIKAGTFG